MRGFMRRWGGAWELRVFLCVDPASGKKRYLSRSVRCGKRDAERTPAQMVLEAEGGHVHRASTTGDMLLDAGWRRPPGLLAEDGAGNHRVHRANNPTGAGFDTAGQASPRRDRPLLRSAAGAGWWQAGHSRRPSLPVSSAATRMDSPSWGDGAMATTSVTSAPLGRRRAQWCMTTLQRLVPVRVGLVRPHREASTCTPNPVRRWVIWCPGSVPRHSPPHRRGVDLVG